MTLQEMTIRNVPMTPPNHFSVATTLQLQDVHINLSHPTLG